MVSFCYKISSHVKCYFALWFQIEFVDSLPKTVSGKIRRVELRQKEWQDKCWIYWPVNTSFNIYIYKYSETPQWRTPHL